MDTISRSKRDRLLSSGTLLVLFCIFNAYARQAAAAETPDATQEVSIHAKLGLRAESFFADTDVIALCEAIERNDLVEIQRLIDSGVDVNCLGRDNATPLLWAYLDNKPPRFEMLLKAGADPNIRLTGDLGVPAGFAKGQSVTTKAARSFFPRHFYLVMEYGGDPHAIDYSGRPLLHAAIFSGVGDVHQRLRHLLHCGADVNAPRSGGSPATISAVSAYQQYDVVNLLLDFGCDHNGYQRRYGTKLIDHLLGAEKNLTRCSLGGQAHYRRAVNRLVALGEDADMVRRHLQARREIREGSRRPGFLPGLNRDRSTPAPEPAPRFWLNARDESIRAQFRLDPGDYFSDAALIRLCRAIVNEDEAALQKLIDSGIDVNTRGVHNATPLLWAYLNDRPKAFARLLEAGADPNVKLTGHIQYPPGFFADESVTFKAAQHHNPYYFNQVMAGGGDPNLTGPLGEPLIHKLIFAANEDTADRVRTLVDRGADINSIDSAGWSAPIMAMCASSQIGVADLLVELGADPRPFEQGTERKLIHFVVDVEPFAPRVGPNFHADVTRLLNRLIAMGEDADAARQDLERWKKAPPSWVMPPEVAETLKPKHDLFRLAAGTPGDQLFGLERAVEDDVDLNQVNRFGETPAMHAVRRYRQFAFALMLLQAGADPDVHRRHPKTGRPLQATLIHDVAAAAEEPRFFGDQHRKDYEALVKWFTDRGDSIEQARRELRSWTSAADAGSQPPNGDEP